MTIARRQTHQHDRAARASGGAVGIWHESFPVPAGVHESVYVDLSAIGLAAAYWAVPASGRRPSACGGRAAAS